MLVNALYDWGGLNREVFAAINGVRGPFVDMLMLTGTRMGDAWNISWVLGLLVILLVVRRTSPRGVLIERLPDERFLAQAIKLFLVGYALAALLVFAGKVGFDMPRPYAALPRGSVHVLALPESPYSFPSGHAAFGMLVAWNFWSSCRKHWRLLLALCVLWIGLSRISVGAHFPADVVAGYLCGGMGAWLAARTLGARRHDRAES